MQKNKQVKFQYLEAFQKSYKTLESELEEFWAQDIWDPHKNPFGTIKHEYDGKRTFYGRYIHFDQINSVSLKTELKYAMYQKMVKKEWTVSTLHHGGANCICRIIKWLVETSPINQSFLDKSLEEWLISLRTWLIEKGLSKQRDYVRYTKEQKAISSKREDDTVSLFKNLYNTLKEVYDEQDFFERDVWICSQTNGTVKGRIYFNDFQQDWLRKLAKVHLKIIYVTRTPLTAYYHYRGLKFFSIFLAERFPSTRIEDIDRQLIVNYLGYVNQNRKSYTEKNCCISSVRMLLEACIREDWAVVKPFLFSFEDYPKHQPKLLPKYIPQKVVEQLEQNLDALPEYLQCAISVLMDTGIRISELINLKFDCLIQDSDGHPFIRFLRYKTKREDSLPISTDLANSIKRQQQKVKEKWDSKCEYLFPSPLKKDIKPISATTFYKNLDKVARERNIRDQNGNIWHFHPHQFRHTVGTSMINKGVPQHIVQRYLGHESPEMTMRYAHIHDETLRKEIEKYHESRVVNFQGETAELDETILSSNDDLEWFKKNVQARALEHGYCARPKVLGDCDIPGFDGCYNCPHWRTNKNFIPILKDTLERTNNVLEKAKNCGWQLQVNKNTPIKENLEKVIKTLEADND